jgi:hypothetical protein
MKTVQNGDVIDHTWTRMKTYRKVLKIRNVVEADTGVLTCRGINGFGSASVRVELLVSGMLGEGAVWGAHLQGHQRLRIRLRQG